MSLNGYGLDGIPGCHVVAIPYPGRGHINPMMNLCTLLASKGLAVTFVVTEEWLTLIGPGSVPNTPNIRFKTIPNVIPSELIRGSDFAGFIEAVYTKMKTPVAELLDGLKQPATCIIADTFLVWAVGIGNRRNIPVALFWPMAPSVFSLHYHYQLLVAHGHLPVPLENFSGDRSSFFQSSDHYLHQIPAMSLNGYGLDGIPGCHVVAIPYPGRGHINPMMNLCTLLASKGLAVTFVVTEEWLTLIGPGSVPNTPNIRFKTIPNVIPSELIRGSDFAGFIEAVYTKMKTPVAELLDGLEQPATCIISDTFLVWAVGIGNQRNIPVALFWPMAPSVFSLHYHYQLLVANGHLPVPLENFSERKEEVINYIPGIPEIRLGDLPSSFIRTNLTTKIALEAFSWVTKAQFILFTLHYELQAHVIDTLRGILPIPIYPIGPSIPFMSLNQDTLLTPPSEASNDNAVDYLNWLDCQPKNSVLYVSLGSFLSVSITQMHEIAMGLRSSGVPYLWVARAEAPKLQGETCGDEMGKVVRWCDQLRVLCHSSVAGFLTHCGWNSILEAIYSGVPMLTFPLLVDQIPSSALIVEDWKIGLNVKEEIGMESVVGRDRIACVVRRLMNGNEGIQLRERAKELQKSCQRALEKDGSTSTNLHAFMGDLQSIRNLEFARGRA